MQFLLRNRGLQQQDGSLRTAYELRQRRRDSVCSNYLGRRMV
jgi:hypothetical protein